MIIELWEGQESNNEWLKVLLNDKAVEAESLKTLVAIEFIKSSLMGEYHGIITKNFSEFIDDAEVYLLTWDSEASDGGRMDKIDIHLLTSIANDSFTKTLSAD